MNKIRVHDGFNTQEYDAIILPGMISYIDKDGDKTTLNYSKDQVEILKQGIFNYHLVHKVQEESKFNIKIAYNGKFNQNFVKIYTTRINCDDMKITIEYEIDGEKRLNTWEIL